MIYRASQAGADGLTPFRSLTAAGLVHVPTCSYDNPGGSGDRSETITVTASGGWDRMSASMLVDGSMGLEGLNVVDAEGCEIIFDFGVERVIQEATFFAYAGFSYGYWAIQGRNDPGGAWSANLCSPTQLVGGGTSAGTVFAMPGNKTAYRYYRFVGTSGTIEDGYFHEVQFKIDEGV